jgi:hypothetical protein
MAVGDEAQAAGYSIVPDTDFVKNGPTEINRTRDYVAQLKVATPNGKAAYRTASGVTSGTADPSGGTDGDIYFKIIG